VLGATFNRLAAREFSMLDDNLTESAASAAPDGCARWLPLHLPMAGGVAIRLIWA